MLLSFRVCVGVGGGGSRLCGLGQPAVTLSCSPGSFWIANPGKNHNISQARIGSLGLYVSRFPARKRRFIVLSKGWCHVTREFLLKLTGFPVDWSHHLTPSFFWYLNSRRKFGRGRISDSLSETLLIGLSYPGPSQQIVDDTPSVMI